VHGELCDPIESATFSLDEYRRLVGGKGIREK